MVKLRKKKKKKKIEVKLLIVLPAWSITTDLNEKAFCLKHSRFNA